MMHQQRTMQLNYHIDIQWMAVKNENTKLLEVLKERWNLKEYGGTKDVYLDGFKI